ncbi:MAG TPA: hypothetical protein VJN29_19350 [Intrasporangium sp.]|nr:hypothetical protein [Intrasporangium sp.]HKX69378.1 hypothetical protein [Intrasporangium sp.]
MASRIDATSALARSSSGRPMAFPWASDQAFWSIEILCRISWPLRVGRRSFARRWSGFGVYATGPSRSSRSATRCTAWRAIPRLRAIWATVDGWSSTASRITQRASVWPWARASDSPAAVKMPPSRSTRWLWITGTAASAARLYHENMHAPTQWGRAPSPVPVGASAR